MTGNLSLVETSPPDPRTMTATGDPGRSLLGTRRYLWRDTGRRGVRQAEEVEVHAACDPDQWVDAARVLFAYQRETAIELGKDPPDHPGEVWRPVRDEVVSPSSAFRIYLVAYRETEALGGLALVAHDALSVQLKRCYVRPEHRRRGVAKALVSAAE